MTKRIALFFLLLAMMATLAVNAAAINTTVGGNCKDENGKPIVGAIVSFKNLADGHVLSLKTDKKGNYFTLAAQFGKYNLTLTSAEGKELYKLNGVTITFEEENTFDIDLGKAQKDAANAPENAAVKAENEKIKQFNETVKTLNAMLAQALELRKEQKYDDAVAIMEKAAEADQGKHDVVYSSLGDSYLGAKRYEDAEKAYSKAIELAPPTSKDIGANHNSLAQALVKEGKTEQAMAEYDKAAQLDPANAGMYFFNEGAILTNQGKVDEANQAFDKAIAADPTRAEAYYQKGLNLLGKATLSKDNKTMIPAPGTVEALNKYLELAPDGKHAQEAKDLLTSVGSTVQTSYGTQKKKK